jgi:hypothetical protein
MVKLSAVSSRRTFLVSAAATLGAGVLGVTSKPAEAFLPLLLRGLALGGARAGAAGLAGRTALAGRGLIRPARPIYTRNQYTGAVQTGRLILQAGRWVNEYSQQTANYDDENEYRYDYSLYPQYFGAAPADLWVENETYRSILMPESDLYLSFDEGRIWQAYRIGEFCVPPGLQTYQFALAGVPTGWDFSGVFETDYGDIESGLVSS